MKLKMSLYICPKIINTAFRMPTMVSCGKLRYQYHRRRYRRCVQISVFCKIQKHIKSVFFKEHFWDESVFLKEHIKNLALPFYGRNAMQIVIAVCKQKKSPCSDLKYFQDTYR